MMERIRLKSNTIEINRNPIERFLMFLKNFIKTRRSLVVYSLLGILVLSVLAIAGSVYLEKRSASILLQYESIMDDFQKGGAENADNISATIERLKALRVSSRFGFIHDMCGYMAGNLYYSQGRFAEARTALVEFASDSSSKTYAPLALIKAAFAAEEAGDIDGALDLYRRLEEKYGSGFLADQIFYNMGRVYSIKGDAMMSKKYYNMVLSGYPKSSFAEKAKKRLYLSDIRESASVKK
jgi:tetratricopeptide (TPR) repeat protein